MLSKALAAAAKAVEPVYVEDVFSTWLYTGNGSTQTITNGIDLSGKGGLVWLKQRSGASSSHWLWDTGRGEKYALSSNSSSSQFYDSLGVAYAANGFSFGARNAWNQNTTTYASWTFRKAAKFFDVVTWTGNGSSLRAINHSLGSTPGCILIKSTSAEGNWRVYHRSLGVSQQLVLNATDEAGSSGFLFGNPATAPTSSSFYVGNDSESNGNGTTYVAYLFAHDAGGFGDSGNDSVVKCGSYTGTFGGLSVDLGWEPQWLMVKSATESGLYRDWYIFDNMRKLDVSNSGNAPLFANSSSAEGGVYASSGYNLIQPRPTGFAVDPSGAGADGVNAVGQTYIYIAIRRGPMKTPTDATKMFSASLRTGTGATATVSSLAFPTDATLIKTRTASIGYDWNLFDRLRGATKKLATNGTSSESTETNGLNNYASMTGYTLGPSGEVNSSSDNFVDYNFRRAPGFFDVVAYTGDGVIGRTVTHNLGVKPDLMIVKNRSAANAWRVYDAFNGATKYMTLNDSSESLASSFFWNNTEPTATTFTLRSNGDTNGSGSTYIAYLFATCPGVSKVGSYTGTGNSSFNVNCGFAAGSRFVLIKRTDSTGDWYVWDSARGLTIFSAPYLQLNSTAAEVTGTTYINSVSAGFAVSAGSPEIPVNITGASYIFLAVA